MSEACIQVFNATLINRLNLSIGVLNPSLFLGQTCIELLNATLVRTCPKRQKMTWPDYPIFGLNKNHSHVEHNVKPFRPVFETDIPS